MSTHYESGHNSPDGEPQAGYAVSAEYVRALVNEPLITEVLETYRSVPLGEKNRERLSELTGGNFPHTHFDGGNFTDIEPPDCPVLPFLRREEDLAGQPLVFVVRSDRAGHIKTVSPDKVDFIPGTDDLKITTEDPYVTTITNILNPALIRQADLEMMESQKPGTGHKGAHGLYWRLVLMETFYRFSYPESSGDAIPNDPVAVFNNINTLSRKCGVPLQGEIKTLAVKLGLA